MSSPGDRGAAGLRERKKAKTRAVIQHHALRLFRVQGYEATTVSQIAAAAEVSESTFFRYFPTKEDVVLWNGFDPRIAEAVRSQPADLSPIQAVRAAFREVLSPLSEEELAEARERLLLVASVPLVRAGDIGVPMRMLAEVVGERSGKPATDPGVRTLVGAVIGACIALILAVADEPGIDVVTMLDDAMARLSAGLPV